MRRRGAYTGPAFKCGDVVRQLVDPKHKGRIVATIGATVRVLWDDTGWRSDHDEGELEQAMHVPWRVS